jgi:hypothetical protein
MPHLRIALLGVAALGFVLPLAIPVAVGQHFHPPQHAADACADLTVAALAAYGAPFDT